MKLNYFELEIKSQYVIILVRTIHEQLKIND